MDVEKQIEQVTNIFTNYLKINKLRKTPERFKILEEIYRFEGHFTIEEFYFFLKHKNYRVSKATLYNTFELLLDCNLIKKHQFNSKSNFYEKSYKSSQHDHLICRKCGKIIEFCDPRIHEIIEDISELYKFEISEHELYLFGQCQECRNSSKD
jgi:Fur family ferric uptake transcriptional regulator